MAATANQLAEIREWVGDDTDDPTDSTLTTLWDRLGSVPGVARAVLRARLSEYLAEPVKLSIDGEISEDRTANIAVLRALLVRLDSEVDAVDAGVAPGVATVGALVRCDQPARGGPIIPSRW
jgi:hypothetical protein